MTMGAGMMSTVMHMAQQGLITGGGPEDPADQAVWRADGRQPYSVKVGDQWVSYQRFDPVAIMIGGVADFAEGRAAFEAGAQDELGGALWSAFTEATINKTWMTGISDIIKAVDSPERFGSAYLANFTGSFIPAIVSQTAQGLDPAIRDPRPDPVPISDATFENSIIASLQSVQRKIQSRLPGLSEDLPMKYDILGRPISREGALGPDIFSPAYLSTDRQDPMLGELMRLRVGINKPQRVINNVKLTPREYADYSRLSGQVFNQEIRRRMATASYQAASDQRKTEIVDKVKDASYKRARGLLFQQRPDIRRRIDQERRRR
jgi:hypothetical protein